MRAIWFILVVCVICSHAKAENIRSILENIVQSSKDASLYDNVLSAIKKHILVDLHANYDRSSRKSKIDHIYYNPKQQSHLLHHTQEQAADNLNKVFAESFRLSAEDNTDAIAKEEVKRAIQLVYMASVLEGHSMHDISSMCRYDAQLAPGNLKFAREANAISPTIQNAIKHARAQFKKKITDTNSNAQTYVTKATMEATAGSVINYLSFVQDPSIKIKAAIEALINNNKGDKFNEDKSEKITERILLLAEYLQNAYEKQNKKNIQEYILPMAVDLYTEARKIENDTPQKDWFMSLYTALKTRFSLTDLSANSAISDSEIISSSKDSAINVSESNNEDKPLQKEDQSNEGENQVEPEPFVIPEDIKSELNSSEHEKAQNKQIEIDMSKSSKKSEGNNEDNKSSSKSVIIEEDEGSYFEEDSIIPKELNFNENIVIVRTKRPIDAEDLQRLKTIHNIQDANFKTDQFLALNKSGKKVKVNLTVAYVSNKNGQNC